ncbi:MAG: class I SAM-dependent methyltransferase [Acidobacteria bacterium]|nr:class I SAM-dependent methyltransferase [Acidobacteriota bacterium]
MTAAPLAVMRGRFQGMKQIFRFNWTLYAAAVAAQAVMLLSMELLFLSGVWRLMYFIGASCALFWTGSSLVVSHYVYDRSPLYRWQWIAERFDLRPRAWVNIHAGLDETSFALRGMFPAGVASAVDVFRSSDMTEGSIRRAQRSASADLPLLRADFRSLPFRDGQFDALFLIFAAHEVRRRKSRLLFFRDMLRTLRRGGHLLLVEHLRDFPNFFAFGPGFLHFFSKREWLRLAKETGFEIAQEFSITPFVRVFYLEKRQ